MPRSTYINTLIGECLRSGMAIVVNDGEEDHICRTFREVANVIDSVDECHIYLKKSADISGPQQTIGWFFLVMENSGAGQLSNYSTNTAANTLIDTIVYSVNALGRLARARETSYFTADTWKDILTLKLV